jgi:hypothetical protein
MKPTACSLLIALLALSGLTAGAGDNTPSATSRKQKGIPRCQNSR